MLSTVNKEVSAMMDQRKQQSTPGQQLLALEQRRDKAKKEEWEATQMFLQAVAALDSARAVTEQTNKEFIQFQERLAQDVNNFSNISAISTDGTRDSPTTRDVLVGAAADDAHAHT
eukprot:5766422-Prorocentrum_lima.AAC.1